MIEVFKGLKHIDWTTKHTHINLILINFYCQTTLVKHTPYCPSLVIIKACLASKSKM